VVTLQLITNAIVTCSVYVLVAIGISFIYKSTRFFHFAHGAIYTSGAYLTFLFNNWFDLPLFYSVALAIILSSVLGCMMEISVFRPLRHKNASPLILILASLGIYIVLQNIISLVFGDATKTIQYGEVEEGINIFGARITPIQIVIICVSISLIVIVTFFLRRSKMGKSMRAVANNAQLSDISGLDSDRVIFWTFAIGSGLSGIAGILISFDVDMTPTMGMNALLMGVVAVIIGGVGSVPGVVLGALLLALAQHIGLWYLSSQWQDAIAFAILLIFLLFRPQGFLGKKVKKVTL